MTRQLSCILLALFALASAARAAATPEETLKSKGLTKVGPTYLLQDDIKFPERLRAMRVIKHRVDQHAAQRIRLEREIERARATILQSARESADLAASLPAARRQSVARHNQVIAEIRAIESTGMEAANYIDQTRKELAKLADPSDDYINSIIQLATQMETLAQQYQTLAADAEVKSATAAINERTGPKVRLGPSSLFNTELPVIRRQRELVKGSVIKLRLEGGTPTANVMINGKVSVPMTVDTGAAAVTLTADSAQKLGLKFDSSNPKVRMFGADGKPTEGRVVTLASVRLGQFIVDDVEAFVFPSSVEGSNLLGGTFLRNFVCRMDLGALELHMSQVAGDPAAAARDSADDVKEPPLEKHERALQEAREAYDRAVLSANKELIKDATEALRTAKGDEAARLDAARKEAEKAIEEAQFKNSGGVKVQVDAIDDWKEVMQVQKGGRYRITAEGNWSHNSTNKAATSGPRGVNGYGVLEAKNGDYVFEIGDKTVFSPPQDGPLLMRMRDTKRSDNSGFLTVTIIREK